MSRPTLQTDETFVDMATQKGGGGEDEAPIHGDVLDAVLSLLPLPDLFSARCVSPAWERAVSSSLAAPNHALNQLPWLICHVPHAFSPFLTATRAYDPRLQVWIHVKPPSPPVDRRLHHLELSAPVRSSHTGVLHALSPSALSFSSDPLHLTWTAAAGGPRVWRTDPIVALVGGTLVVAGGVCEFEDDDPLSVEAYDIVSREWRACPSMPASLKGSASSTWLSAGVEGRRLFLTEKSTGVTHSLDPESGTWSGPYDLRPDPNAFFSAVGFAGGRMILVALIGGGEEERRMRGVKVYEVDGESMERSAEIGEMPRELAEEAFVGAASIGVCAAEDYVYMHNPWMPEEVAFCELGGGGGVRRWGSVRNPMMEEKMGRVVYSCSKVGMDDLQTRRRRRSFTSTMD